MSVVTAIALISCSNVGAMPHMLQPEELEQRGSLWQQQLMEYRQQRQAVIEKRREDIQLRNVMKKQQIELAEQWQVILTVCLYLWNGICNM